MDSIEIIQAIWRCKEIFIFFFLYIPEQQFHKLPECCV